MKSNNSEYIELLRKNNLSPDYYDIWAYPKFSEKITENYGWKIHISAISTNAIHIAKHFLDLNRKYNFDFKIISTLEYLDQMNNGYFGNSQVGKFITIYPPQKDVAAILELLHYEFHNEVGIAVGSDISYKLNSNVYYRYGTISKDILHIDKRDKQLHPPLNSEFILDYQIKRLHQLPKKYLIIKPLRQIGPTGTFIGLDIEKKQKVIIRYSTKLYNLSLNMVDGNDRLFNEYCLLQKKEIKTNSFFETVLDIFYMDNSVFLVTKFYDGYTLDQLTVAKVLDTYSLDTKIKIFTKITTALSTLHKNNIIFQDLSFDNVMISNSKIKLIDFEYALSITPPISYCGKEVTLAGTYGFMNLEDKHPNKDTDLFCLKQCFIYLMYPELYRTTVKKIQPKMNLQEIKKLLIPSYSKLLPTNLNKIYQKILHKYFLS